MTSVHSRNRKSERATNPEDLARLFVERANAGDVEGLVDLYEPNAVLARSGQEPAVGSAAIRSFYAALLSQRPTFEPGQHQPVLRNGDLALTSSQLADGAVTGEIARWQTDGFWLWIVDQPTIFKPHKITATPVQRGVAHERLSVFIGKWHAEGDSYAAGQTKNDPRGSVEKWISDETYVWLPGQFFVIQTWDAMTGANPFKGTAIISYDAATGAYMTRS